MIEDYKATGNKTIANAKGKIEHGLRPFFGDMLAERVISEEIERWMRWRANRRLRKSDKSELLQPASINREMSLLRRAFQLGCERKPQLVDEFPPDQEIRG